MDKEILNIVNQMLGRNYKELNWSHISAVETLDERFMRTFQDYLDWDNISRWQKLSEDFMIDFKDKLNWLYLQLYQDLSENFINIFRDKVDWDIISRNQILSEDFIRAYADKVNWHYISKYQHLSEPFIREFINKVKFRWISARQKLSEDFIRTYADKVSWYYISMVQTLSEAFIKEFKDKVNWENITRYQKLSNEFINDFSDILKANGYLWDNVITYQQSATLKTAEEKKQAVIATGLYDCYDNYFVAYKAVRSDRYPSKYFTQRYFRGDRCESFCDCVTMDESFGLSAGTENTARIYQKLIKESEIIRVEIYYADLGILIDNGNSLRCFSFKVID